MTDHDDGFVRRDSMIERLIYSIVLLILFAITRTILWAVVLIQYGWMLFHGGAPNLNVAEFGARLAVWMKRATMYLAAATDEKPFPWREID